MLPATKTKLMFGLAVLLAVICGQTSSNPLFPALTELPTLSSLPNVLPNLAGQAVANFGAIQELIKNTEHLLINEKDPEDKLNPIDAFLLDVIPVLIGQRPNNENGTKWQYKEYAMKDVSNDDAVKMTGQQLILRSGFNYTLHEAIADDGYVTQVTRLINPKADPRKLRQPPVLLEHGGTIDPTAYLIGSSIQHFPEKWPRTAADGPITSWNRSLAFVLSNNGFDVFLAETRGSNENNKKRVKSRAMETVRSGANRDKNMTRAENFDELSRVNNYWDFSQDDIIAHEIKSHMDLVLSLTGAKKLHLFTFSLSTPTSLAFLSIRPDYAAKVQGYVSMAPIVSGEGVNLLIKLVLQTLCPILPNEIGTLLVSDLLFTQPIRDLVVAIAKSRVLRYSTVKAFTTLLMGASAKYETLLDLNVLGHMLRELSFKEAKQLCQQTKANKLQKYDYGPIKNRILYKSTTPPVYDLSNLNIKDWIIISAANDALSTPKVVEHLISLVRPKPIAHLVAPGMNHLDLIAGFGNDEYVNIPVLRYFQRMSFNEKGSTIGQSQNQIGTQPGGGNSPMEEEELIVAKGKVPATGSKRVRRIVQPDIATRIFTDATNTITTTITNMTGPIESNAIMERFQKGFGSLFSAFTHFFNVNARNGNNEVGQAGDDSGKLKI